MRKRLSSLVKKTVRGENLVFPFFLCVLFFTAYLVLSFVRHDHYHSFGYDLGINDQTVWRYAHFQAPVTTIDPFPDRTKLVEHVELIYALIAPFFWIWESRKMLLLVEAATICISAIAVFLLARKKGLSAVLSGCLMVGYLGFYGVQYVVWFDTHSSTYAAAFLMWFIYSIETKRRKLSLLFFFLAITAKENIGLLTFFVSAVYFLKQKEKIHLFFMAVSVLYVSFIFLVFFPYIVRVEYLYANSGGYFSNLNPLTFADSDEKRQVIWYSLLSFGFLPLLSPLYLIPAIADLGTYFVVANQLPGAQGLYGHYRVTLAPFLLWATIMTISKYSWMHKWYIGMYLIVSIMLVQYLLHLPLSYLSKSWFWDEPSGVPYIEAIKNDVLSPTASVVAQNNIVPHLSHRDKIYSLYPEQKYFSRNSPCGQPQCEWFRWFGSPTYLFVDTSPEWDARHLLTDRPRYLQALANIEKAGVVIKYKQVGSAILYRVLHNPEEIQ